MNSNRKKILIETSLVILGILIILTPTAFVYSYHSTKNNTWNYHKWPFVAKEELAQQLNKEKP